LSLELFRFPRATARGADQQDYFRMIDLWQHIVADFSNLGSPAALTAFGQVVLIDVMLAADNAIVVGALAAGLPAAMRRKVILIGVLAALGLRIVFAACRHPVDAVGRSRLCGWAPAGLGGLEDVARVARRGGRGR
jgi:hypothetical protein